MDRKDKKTDSGHEDGSKLSRFFSPLIFLASLGAGGIAVMPFAFLQYTFSHGPGLVKIADIGHGTLPLSGEAPFARSDNDNFYTAAFCADCSLS